MKHKIIRALLVEPEKHPKITYIPLSTDVFNAFMTSDPDISILLSTIQVEANIFAVYNDNAVLLNLPGNRRIGNRVITDTFLLISMDEDGNIQSLPHDKALQYKSQFWEPEHFSYREQLSSYFTNLYISLDDLDKCVF